MTKASPLITHHKNHRWLVVHLSRNKKKWDLNMCGTKKTLDAPMKIASCSSFYGMMLKFRVLVLTLKSQIGSL